MIPTPNGVQYAIISSFARVSTNARLSWGVVHAACVADIARIPAATPPVGFSCLHLHASPNKHLPCGKLAKPLLLRFAPFGVRCLGGVAHVARPDMLCSSCFSPTCLYTYLSPNLQLPIFLACLHSFCPLGSPAGVHFGCVEVDIPVPVSFHGGSDCPKARPRTPS